MKAGSTRVIVAALAVNFAIAITKFIAAAITGSSAMLSEGIHSIVDTGNQGLLLYGLKRAKKAPDALHPFGHGKEVYFWSFVVALLVFALGAGISMYEGIVHILHPTEVRDPTINYIVLALAMMFEGYAWKVALNAFNAQRGKLGYIESVRRTKDPTILVVLFEDSAALLGLTAAFVGVAASQITQNALYDGIASVIIGIILAVTAMWLAFETKGLLIGESARGYVVQSVRDMVQTLPSVKHVNEVLTMHMGPDFILANISIEFHDGLKSDDIENAIGKMSRSIKNRHPEIKRIFIEAESRESNDAEAQEFLDSAPIETPK